VIYQFCVLVITAAAVPFRLGFKTCLSKTETKTLGFQDQDQDSEVQDQDQDNSFKTKT